MYLIDESEDVRAISVAPKLDGDGRQRSDRETGKPQWVVTGLHQPRNNGAPSLLKVTVAADKAPDFVPMSAGFHQLECDVYQLRGEGGGVSSAGLWWRAAAVVDFEE